MKEPTDRDLLSRELTNKECKALQRYYDGGSRYFERRRVERMLAERESARNYLASLEEMRLKLRAEMEPKVEVDLWARISGRIAQEEYAAIFQGRRQQVVDNTSAIGWRSGLLWGMGGAMTAAACLAIVVGLQGGAGVLGGGAVLTADSGSHENEQIIVAGATAPQIRFVNQQEMPQNVHLRTRLVEPRFLPGSGGSPVEVEWLRSDGRVSMIPSKQYAPIIWVNRGEGMMGRNVSQRGAPPLPMAADLD